MHVRLQTWFPFTLQVYVNGHSWLARQMERRDLRYQAADNAFTFLADPARAQKLADQLLTRHWPRLLSVFARHVNPLLADLFRDFRYYRVADQAEYATDLLFRDCAALARLYPRMLEHATLHFSAEDVLTFLGRKLTGQFAVRVRRRGVCRGAVVTGWAEGQRRSARLNRQLRWLRAHGLIARIPRTRRYRVTVSGYTSMSATLHLHRQPMASTPHGPVR